MLKITENATAWIELHLGYEMLKTKTFLYINGSLQMPNQLDSLNMKIIRNYSQIQTSSQFLHIFTKSSEKRKKEKSG